MSANEETTSKDHQEELKKKFKCDICKKVYPSRSGLVRHLQIHSDNRPTFECQECGKVMSTKKILANHMKIHLGVKAFKCNDCGMEFATKSALKSHINSFHTPDELKEMATCPVCKKVLTTNHMYAHMKIHTGEDRHECPECKKIYLSKKSLKNHLKRTHTTDKAVFNCEHCGNSFKDIHILRRHMMTHSDSRPTFECKFCHKKFISKRGMEIHEKLHTGEKPYFCQLCHNKSFRTMDHLKRHMMFHKGERPFKCGICSKTFVLAGNLKTHMLIHSEDEPFSCPNAPNCPKRFKRKQNSQLHFLNCRAEKPMRSLKEDGDENESSPLHTARRYGGCPPSNARQKSDSSIFTKKECTVVIKRTGYIERAIRDGYSSFTFCWMSCKRGGAWKISDLIATGPRPKKKK